LQKIFNTDQQDRKFMTRIFPINIFRNHLLKLLLFCFFSFIILSLSAQTNTTIEADYQDAIKKR